MQYSIAPFFSIVFRNLFLSFDILNLDYDVGTALGIGEFAGGILLVLILALTTTALPLWKKSTSIAFVISILVMCFGIAVGWLSIFVLVLVVFAVALGLADRLTGILGGRLGGS